MSYNITKYLIFLFRLSSISRIMDFELLKFLITVTNLEVRCVIVYFCHSVIIF